ncbi:hypothetical protein CSOJ01_00018 [Colletotrichum sojae]|uniref:Uncharacterized protein n=1 Tax=Colletotrichum sojae TaxID=2175907 RepID=A0A8H6JYN3_9PEZI|nr:hypothetical protein CSOJ01_00018 [Colletotrichum sojae]
MTPCCVLRAPPPPANGGERPHHGTYSPTPNAGAIGGHSLPSTEEIQGMFQRPTVLSHHHHQYHWMHTDLRSARVALAPRLARLTPNRRAGDSTVSGFSNHTTAIEICNAQH